MAGVLAAELARAFEPDTEPAASDVSWLREKESAGRLQTDLLLILQRAHGGRHLEMTMEGRRAYRRQLRKACQAPVFIPCIAIIQRMSRLLVSAGRLWGSPPRP